MSSRRRRRANLADRAVDRWDSMGWPARALVLAVAVALWVVCLMAAALTEGFLLTLTWGWSR